MPNYTYTIGVATYFNGKSIKVWVVPERVSDEDYYDHVFEGCPCHVGNYTATVGVGGEGIKFEVGL